MKDNRISELYSVFITWLLSFTLLYLHKEEKYTHTTLKPSKIMRYIIIDAIVKNSHIHIGGQATLVPFQPSRKSIHFVIWEKVAWLVQQCSQIIM